MSDNKVSEEEIKECVEKNYGKMSLREMAKKLGTTHNRVSRITKKMGLDTSKSRPKRSRNPEFINFVKENYQKMTKGEMSRVLGLGTDTYVIDQIEEELKNKETTQEDKKCAIDDELNKHTAYEAETKNSGYKKCEDPKIILFVKEHYNSMSTTRMAEKMGVSTSPIREIMRRNGWERDKSKPFLKRNNEDFCRN